MVIDNPIIELPPTVRLGPGLEADIRRRVRELEGRYPRALTNAIGASCSGSASCCAWHDRDAAMTQQRDAILTFGI